MPAMLLETQNAPLGQKLGLEKEWALCGEGLFLSPLPGPAQSTSSAVSSCVGLETQMAAVLSQDSNFLV